MNYRPISLVIGLALGSPTWVSADPIGERMARMEAMMAEMQRELDAQKATIQQQATTIAEQKAHLEGAPPRVEKLTEDIEAKKTDDTEGKAPWYSTIEIAGVIEVEATHYAPYVGQSESDLALATFELGIAAQITDWLKVEASLLYEEDDTPLEVDVASVTFANPEQSPWFVTAGQIYVPFGAYETNMVSDPLTLEIGETRETALQAGFVKGDFNGSLYVFNGDNEKDGKSQIGAWGAALGFAREWEGGEVAAGIGYLSDLGDSDTLQGVINDNRGDNDTDLVPAWTVNAKGRFGQFTLIGEYLAATESFEVTAVPWRSSGARPSAWNLEVGYAFELFDKPSTFAVGYQGAREALALELPKQRLVTALSTEIYDQTKLSFEWAHDKDYSANDGGTGKNADTLTAQLAVDF